MSQPALTWLDELRTDYSRRSGSVDSRVSRRSAGQTVAYLAGGMPDPRDLPRDSVIEATATALEREGEWALQYGAPLGDPNLTEVLIEKLARDQGISAGPENLLITAGAAQAVALATRLLVDPGDVVISEAPTWAGAVRRFSVYGADVREVGVDAGGTDVDQLEATLKDLEAEGKRAKFFYILPNFQNPMGVTTTLERRRRIVELAAQHGVPIIEDDAYFDLRFDGEHVPSLYSLDDSRTTLYMGTFSKIMAAGIRLGWVVASPDVVTRLAGLKLDGGTNPFASHVAAEWTRNGSLHRHIQMLIENYRVKRDRMLAALEAHMPEGTRWTRPEGGFFIWLTLPEGADAGDVARRASQRGVEVIRGADFYFSDRGHDELRLSYSYPTLDEIDAGIEILGEEIRAALR